MINEQLSAIISEQAYTLAEQRILERFISYLEGSGSEDELFGEGHRLKQLLEQCHEESMSTALSDEDEDDEDFDESDEWS